jgi:hypothetical protein
MACTSLLLICLLAVAAAAPPHLRRSLLDTTAATTGAAGNDRWLPVSVDASISQRRRGISGGASTISPQAQGPNSLHFYPIAGNDCAGTCSRLVPSKESINGGTPGQALCAWFSEGTWWEGEWLRGVAAGYPCGSGWCGC